MRLLNHTHTCTDPARYETLTEDEALDVFSKVALPRGEFDAIKREIEQALVQSCT